MTSFDNSVVKCPGSTSDSRIIREEKAMSILQCNWKLVWVLFFETMSIHSYSG